METNKKQTAVEWLEQELFRRYNFIDDEFIFHQAKQMEKGQHSETWIDAQSNLRELTFIGKEKRFEDYYNQTYNTETHGI